MSYSFQRTLFKEIDRLKKQVEEMQKELEGWKRLAEQREKDSDKWEKRAFDKVKANQEMQKTLEWYASEEGWGTIEELGAFVGDGGERARQALKGIN